MSRYDRPVSGHVDPAALAGQSGTAARTIPNLLTVAGVDPSGGAGVLADITRIMADEGVSIDAMLQRQPSEGANTTDIILMTHRTVEKCIDIASRRVEALPSVTAAPVRLRVEALD